jgi:hypothetical protein
MLLAEWGFRLKEEAEHGLVGIYLPIGFGHIKDYCNRI